MTKQVLNTVLNKPKILFIDIDGTIYSKQNHLISTETINAMHSLKKNGIKLILCTARSKMETSNIYSILEKIIDGICYLSGGYIECGEYISKTYISKSDVDSLITYFKQENLQYKYVDMQARDFLISPIEKILQGFIRNYQWKPSCKPYENEDLLQILVFINYINQAQAINVLVDDASLVTMKNVIEITGKDCNKKTAIKKICSLYSVKSEECASIGDGLGDLPMFEITFGIAMENANENVKSKASFVTKSVDEEGFAFAMIQNKWI